LALNKEVLMFQGNNYVDGEFFSAYGHFEAVNPATEEVYGNFPLTTSTAVEVAVKAAKKAQFAWRRESRVKRAEYFDKLAQLVKRDHDKLRDAISVETGKNLNESHAEVVEALHMCQVAAGMGRQSYGEVFGSELSTKDAYVVRKPRGVVAVISPWNFPLAIGSFWCAAPALVEGNTVVHKPSELTPMVNQMAAELYHEAGFPAGVYNLVHGDGITGAALVESDVDVILFTGSAEVGKLIRAHCATTDSKTCSIECGSKSATMVFDDGDLDLALDVGLASAFKLSGQRCVSSSRLLVQRSVFDLFAERFVEAVRSEVFVSDPFKWPGGGRVCFGPLISAEHHARVHKFNQMVREDGHATVLYDPDGLEGSLKTAHGWTGYFMRPFVYKAEWRDIDYLKQEVFGPHVALIPFDDLDHAIWIYNDTDYGLSLGAVTDDYRKHREIVNRCTAGMVYINGGSIAAESHLPFSSWKKSGYGASATATWKAVTHTTAVTVNYEQGKVSWAQGME
jgi:aldehyde dehydrogenase (NAD+)